MSRARHIFGWPIVLALLGLVGLVVGLLDDGLFDWIAWVCVGSAVVAIFWALATRRA